MKRITMSFLLAAGMVSAAAAEIGVTATPQASTATEPAAPAAPAVASDVSVEKIAVGTGIESHAIQGEASEFPMGSDRVVCLTRVVSAKGSAAIKHVWSKDGVKLGEISLNIPFSPYTTYSNHGVQPGAWTVEVQDEAGQTVSSVQFTVK